MPFMSGRFTPAAAAPALPGRPGNRPALTLGEADRALYDAKAAGRDRVACLTGDPQPLRLVAHDPGDADRAAQ